MARRRKTDGNAETNHITPKEVDDCFTRLRRAICRIFEPFGYLDGLTFFTAVLAFIAFLQWRTFEKTDQTLKLQQRAWIAPRGVAPIPDNFINRKAAYTEIPFRFDNIGKEPATEVNEEIHPTTIKVNDFRNEKIMMDTISAALAGRDCGTIPANRKGRAVYPGGSTAIVLPFGADQMELINSRNYYALIVGCFVYRTVKETHRSKVCMILQPDTEKADSASLWHSIGCPIHNDAD